ncbi:MAG: hypothetical protein KDA90_21580 [Planctomycetaceae bacterium]|nr:hypothetical protein [Planctomycetaceae bacterium]
MRISIVVHCFLVILATWAPVPSVGGDAAISGATSAAGCRCVQSGQWTIWETANFRICTRDPNFDLTTLPEITESLKRQIESAWFPGATNADWRPRCEVIVHATLGDYQRTLGPGVGTSVGCATMQYNQGRVISRRIDIRVDADGWLVDALPHELTHVVLADRLGNRPLPPWLDEGIGVLSESDLKRQARAAAYEVALHRQTTYSLAELTHLRSFPRPEYRDAFYVQSAALVRLLRDRSGPDEFARFADLAVSGSVEQALRTTYRVKRLDELDQALRAADPALLVEQGGTLPAPATLVADAAE